MDKEWWRKFRTCKDLSHWFINHLVGLLISYQFNNQIFERVHTGFLLFHRNVLLWVTAGHVIDNIRELTSNPEIRTLGMSWLDGCDIEGAESVVVHDRNLDMFSSNNRGIDFGVINIAGLDEANILANDNVKIMTQQVWKNLGNAIPEGYYVLGFPKEWVEVQKTNLNNKQLFLSTIAKLACIPISKIEYQGSHPTKEFWDDPGAFYGQIRPFSDKSGEQPIDIDGMSGGPVFSIEKDPKGVVYRLFGILRSVEKSQGIIRAEPINRIVDILNE